MALSPDQAEKERQTLNEEAYFCLLKAFLARGKNDIMLTVKLRKELNISNMQHGKFLEELRAAVPGGPSALEAVRGPGSARGVTKPTRGAGSSQRQPQAQQVVGQRTASRKNSKTQPAQVAVQQQQSQQLSSEDTRMVGYKVQYFVEANNQWQEGVITAYQPPNIIITFGLGTTAHPTDMAVRWEQSDNLQMMQEVVDSKIIEAYRASRRY